MSDAMQAVPRSTALVKAWEAYKGTDDYQNTKRWAIHPEHVEGSLWAVFMKGWNAAAVPATPQEGVRMPISESYLALAKDHAEDMYERGGTRNQLVANAIWHMHDFCTDAAATPPAQEGELAK